MPLSRQKEIVNSDGFQKSSLPFAPIHEAA